MPQPFDPYEVWLGIGAEDRPLTPYRLLGIEPTESDLQVVTDAAEARLRQIKSRAGREHVETARRLEQEILGARNKLLRALVKSAHASPGESSQSAQPQSNAPGAPASDVSVREVAARTARPRTWLRRFLDNPFAGTVLGGAIAGVIYLGILWWTRGGTGPAVTPPPAPAATGQGSAAIAEPVESPGETAAGSPRASEHHVAEESGPLNPVDTSETLARIAGAQPIQTSQARAAPGAGSEAALDPQRAPKAASRSDAPGAMTSEDTEKNEPEKPAAKEHAPSSNPVERATAKEKESRHAVPDQADQQEAEKQLRKLLRDDFAAARSPEQSLVLARSLLKLAAETRGDLTTRYVLLHMAEQSAADAGNLALACDAVDKIAAEYDVEPWSRKVEALARVLDVARSVRGPSPIGEQALREADRLVTQALEADQYPVARQITATMLTAVRRVKNAPLARELGVRGQEIRRLEDAFAKLQQARAFLANNPGDAEANLTAGRWHGFVKGEWQKAMPLLAKGSDVLLAQVAQDDLAQPTKPEARAELADAWWHQCLKETGPARSTAARRAVFWYDFALEGLSGTAKIQAAQKRLEALATVSDPTTPDVEGAIEEGNVALARNGTTVTSRSKITGAESVVDGSERSVAYSVCPCEWTITLGKAYRLREIRLHLYRPEEYSYHYGVATSSDGKDYFPLFETTSDRSAEVQQVLFSPRTVKSVKLIGLASTDNSNNLMVREFEAYCIPSDAASTKEP